MKDQGLLLLKQPIWRLIDQSSMGPSFEALQSFAMDDTLCASSGSGGAPATARSWVHHQTIVLGTQDARTPHLKEGLKLLEEEGWRYIVRNSGGLAVVLDEGVLNISLVFSEKDKRIDIDSGYDAMHALVIEMFADFGKKIEAREIVHSYCPGSYDLSIEGRKFAGISQRRLRGGIAVQIYLCMNGSGAERAALVKRFYDRAIQGEQTKFSYPDIHPEDMASLSELFGTELTIQDGMLRFLTALKSISGTITAGSLNGEELDLYAAYYDRVIKRNESVLLK
ncbi:lipoate--protein ligase family protein [Jeotgalibacillus salarius]|uniref:Octanoyl-[GcvH]:protein N-octanoyltransferase n=1 Tax=Jeotgalibacillus salarius TaxID=546023 RepID=A0A4Y8LTA0_9BACL|nr:lipoate--protein ligase family protein [Jeotgalibacillus salarius]TFE04195.1 lipoate--protein ligase family protein [Jeotgalibacillus salarius]